MQEKHRERKSNHGDDYDVVEMKAEVEKKKKTRGAEMGAGAIERECEKVGSGVRGVQTDRERRVMGRERVGIKKKERQRENGRGG